MNPIGWREYESAPQASAVTLDALRELAVSLLRDNMARSSGMVDLRPFHQPNPMAGTAVTRCGLWECSPSNRLFLRYTGAASARRPREPCRHDQAGTARVHEKTSRLHP
jgi:hypothetical protein